MDTARRARVENTAAKPVETIAGVYLGQSMGKVKKTRPTDFAGEKRS